MLAQEPREIPTVTCLDDASRWAEHCLGVARRVLGTEALLDARRVLNQLTLSTAFSGVGAPEVALDALVSACEVFCGARERDVEQSLWAFEIDEECRHELSMLKRPPLCVFKDYYCHE